MSLREVLMGLKSEHDKQIKFAEERPQRLEKWRQQFDLLKKAVETSIEPFRQDNLIVTETENFDVSHPDFGTVSVTALLINAFDNTLRLAPVGTPAAGFSNVADIEKIIGSPGKVSSIDFYYSENFAGNSGWRVKVRDIPQAFKADPITLIDANYVVVDQMVIQAVIERILSRV